MAIVQINQDHTTNITQIISPNNNKGGLFLGNQKAASNIELLKKHGITCVLTVAGEINNKYFGGVTHKKIHIDDQPLQNIYQHFEPNYNFIKKGLSNGNVLIHCMMGMSRSASLVIAFLMRKYKVGYEKAFCKVKDRRPIVNPNPGFVQQLKKYDSKIKETTAKSSFKSK